MRSLKERGSIRMLHIYETLIVHLQFIQLINFNKEKLMNNRGISNISYGLRFAKSFLGFKVHMTKESSRKGQNFDSEAE